MKETIKKILRKKKEQENQKEKELKKNKTYKILKKWERKEGKK